MNRHLYAALLIVFGTIGLFYKSPFTEFQENPAPADLVCPVGRVHVGILSSYENIHRRDAIRATWASDISRQASQTDHELAFDYKFYIGRSNVARDNSKVRLEELFFHDIVFLPSSDRYEKLAWKTIEFYRYARRHVSKEHTHIMKIDDDTFLFKERFSKHLSMLCGQHARDKQTSRYHDRAPILDFETISGKRPMGGADKVSILGYIKINADSSTSVNVPDRVPGSKWFIDNSEYPWGFYPPFPQGNLYMMTIEAARLFVLCADETRERFKFEDVYIGLTVASCSHMRGTGLVHSSRFMPGYPSIESEDWIAQYGFSQHYAAPRVMKSLYTLVTREGKDGPVEDTTSIVFHG